ncbi:MAG: site-specific integrase [Actinomycetota bacterium]|nr:site-specific integrase [Actinomycetota bacterium]
MSALAPTLQSFFASYLCGQRAASRHTITAYRDTFRLLLGYVQEQTGVRPSDVDIAMLDAELVGEFLTMLEQRRGNSTRTRNARLAAIHSLFSHAALRHPEHAELIARVLAIPSKHGKQTVVSYLNDAEVETLLATPDRATWSGRRDHLLLLLMVTTGLRVSEVTSLVRADISTDRRFACVSCTGKGRKQRVTPIDRPMAAALKAWLAENTGNPNAPLFTAQGTSHPLSSDAVAQRVRLHATAAAATCPTLATKNVTPHVLRHTCAMRMLAAGVGMAAVSLFLGHESLASTRPYIHADLKLKQRALDRTAPPRTKKGRYQPTDNLLAFLEAL